MTTILSASVPTPLAAGDVVLDLLTRELTGPTGRKARLPRGAFVIMRELMRRPGEIVSVDRLISAVWNDVALEPFDAPQGVRKRVLAARAALAAVGIPRNRLRLHFLDGYALDRQPGEWRRMTREQADAFDRRYAGEMAA